ncbi:MULTISPECIES: M15 family metallopeptidase [Paenibacillus]|uniref:Peptidoglycan L-alanyl-D-glutamate endopeptidase CwlK n=1 Tax=Paenibacillus pabuli TaxID=1472 RepID=A0A855Y733_9BACL|nr:MULTISPECIES: M15 family metallopeptidase [Paenibacillus]PWW37411.1 peptidoglycan L-alanyl-D-glutamate endopeptidase CwlK [Paenibacillus pabuli]PXW05553.1 peptidoglycan L-alanyl-D-glutamate endopeptidase CwlK [Paenibacillus taichungensis]
MLTLDQVKAKSQTRLSGVNPVIRQLGEALIERCYNKGIMILITQGLRTYAEQDALYAQGRTKPGSIVTNVKGGYSIHNFGFAIDYALLLQDGKTASWDTKRDDNKDSKADFLQVAEEAKALGFEWGGDWKSFVDMPHLQMVFGLTTAQFRAGQRPTQAQLDAALSKIKPVTPSTPSKEGEPMTAEEKKEFEQLKEDVKALQKRVNINGDQTPPNAYHEALEAAKHVKAITTTNDKDQSALKMLQTMYNMGLFEPRFVEFVKSYKGQV